MKLKTSVDLLQLFDITSQICVMTFRIIFKFKACVDLGPVKLLYDFFLLKMTFGVVIIISHGCPKPCIKLCQKPRH
jgi:hypothetical protein